MALFQLVIEIVTGRLYKRGQGMSLDPRSDRQPEKTNPQEAQDGIRAQEQDPSDSARRFFDPDRGRNSGQLNRFKPQGPRLAPIIQDRQPP